MADVLIHKDPVPCGFAVPDSLFACPLNLGWPCDLHWHVADISVCAEDGPTGVWHVPAASPSTSVCPHKHAQSSLLAGCRARGLARLGQPKSPAPEKCESSQDQQSHLMDP